MQTGEKLNNIGMVKINKDREITTNILTEIPKIFNNEYAISVNRGNKMRWIDSNIKYKLDVIMHQYDDKLNEKIGYAGFDMLVNKRNSDENILCNLVVDAINI